MHCLFSCVGLPVSTNTQQIATHADDGQGKCAAPRIFCYDRNDYQVPAPTLVGAPYPCFNCSNATTTVIFAVMLHRIERHQQPYQMSRQCCLAKSWGILGDADSAHIPRDNLWTMLSSPLYMHDGLAYDGLVCLLIGTIPARHAAKSTCGDLRPVLWFRHHIIQTNERQFRGLKGIIFLVGTKESSKKQFLCVLQHILVSSRTRTGSSMKAERSLVFSLGSFLVVPIF